ncbi:PHP domain-containing protein [Longibaculum muris]|uniref:PHP domain-containing protein n=1 Tax=Longibaculum muris TaxID=1796628 RepID=UPI0012B9A732|nr:PHP domain-containing protein [Longibaculum muris]
MIYADLHVHTNHSDGTQSIDSVFKQAKEKGIHTIAITDHDTVNHYQEILLVAQKYQLETIRGVEMSCYDEVVGKKIHIVGLWLNEEVPHVEKLCQETLKCRDQYHHHLIELLNQKGYDISYEDAKAFSPYNIVFKIHIFLALMKKYPDEMSISRYRELFAGQTSRDVDRQMGYIDIQKGIEAIHLDGGIAILAHPCEYDNYDEIEKYVGFGLDGIEVSHPSMQQEDYPRTLEYAKKLHLLKSGGSDFHDERLTILGKFGLTKEQYELLMRKVHKI